MIPDKNISKKFLYILNNAKNVLITSHLNPDGDAIGSCIALSYYLDGIGIKNEIVLNNLPSDSLSFLNGFDKIKTDTDTKSFDLCVVMDLSNRARLGKVSNYLDRCEYILLVDHHVPDEVFGDFRIIDSSAPATTYVLTRMFQMERVSITPQIANALLIGIVTDTSHFRNQNTSAASLAVAAYLMEQGGDLLEITTKTLERPKEGITLVTYAYNNLKICSHGKVCWTSLPFSIFESTGTDESHSEGIVNDLLNISGVEYAVIFKETNPGFIRVSFRCVPGKDVAKVANIFGGGGHVAAAGCTIEGNLDDVMPKVINELDKCLESTV